MSQFFKNRGKLTKANIVFVLTLMAGLLITGVVFAQKGGLVISTKAGDPTELMADGKSQTRLMFDLSGCVWYPGAGPEDLLQIQLTSDLGTSLSPPSVFDTVEKVGSPFEVVLKSGTQYGTAKVTTIASFCTEGNTVVMGQCSSQQEQNTPKCTGEFEIPIRPADASEEGEESSEESEETEDLGVSISCPSSPKAGTSVTCTASVSGAKQDETLDYFWSLEGKAGTGTKNNTFTWEAKETGYYEVSVEVFGKDKDRTTKKTLRVNVIESDSTSEEEKTEDSISSGTSDASGLVSSLESFLKAAGVKNINPAKLAVAGTGISALIAIWMITQNRSGVPMEKLEKALGQWRWKEGQKVPKPASEGKKKRPEKLPEKPPEKAPQDLPEGLKSDIAQTPQVTLPEEVEAVREAKSSAAAEEAQASASAKVEEPAKAETPPAKKAVSGETAEEWIERHVDNTEDIRSAVDKTLGDFKKRIEGVPKEVKESEFWKQKVAPKLKKLDDLAIEGKSGKLKEFLRITKELLQVRKKIDAKLSILPEKDRQGVIWLTRGLQAGEEGLKKIHQQLITDPAIAAAKKILSKEQAAAVEKFLNRHQNEIGEMLGGIKKLPAELVDKSLRASQRDQDVQDIIDDVYKGIRHNKPTKFKEKGLSKIQPAIDWIDEKGSALRKWIGKKGPVFLRDTTPSQE